MTALTHLSLCTGIGGIDLAAEWAGFHTVGQCEIEDFQTRVLEKHWPNVRRWRDIHDVTVESVRAAGIERIDMLSAGYPCQPFSNAGKRGGATDDRHLWPQVFRVVQETKPRWCLFENVDGHVSLGLGDVLSDLETGGYTTIPPVVIPACAVNAPHQRYRIFIVAYANSVRWDSGGNHWAERHVHSHPQWDTAQALPNRKQCEFESRENGEIVAYPSSERIKRERTSRFEVMDARDGERASEIVRDGTEQRRSTFTGVDRSFDGIPNWVDGCNRWPAPYGQPQYEWEPPRVAVRTKYQAARVGSLGNAVVPQQVYPILQAIYATEMQIRGGR